MYFLQVMREQLLANVDQRQISSTLERLQKAQSRFEEFEPWMVLVPRVPQVWEQILREAIVDLDDTAIGALVSLAGTPGPEGKYGEIEACRITCHVLKDRRTGWRPSNSWLTSTVGEAKKALRNPQAWKGSKGG